MMKSLITIADLDGWQACGRKEGEKYSDENLAILLGGRFGWIPVELLRDWRITAEDRIWAVLRLDVIGAGLYERFGHICVDRAVGNLCQHYGTRVAETWARAWAAEAVNAAQVGVGDVTWVDQKVRAVRERQWQCEKLAEMIEKEEQTE